MTLKYLDFDYSEDEDGTGTFDAMASVCATQVAALHDEIAAVLSWAHEHWPQACAALEDGGEWHYDMQGAQEVSTPLALEFDDTAGKIHAALGVPAPPRTTITLTISGHAAFCEALREAFRIE